MKKRIIVAVALAIFLAASAFAQSSDLFTLVTSGTPQQIQTAIKQGANVNALDNDGWTPLMVAAGGCKNPDVITALLQAGAKTETQNKEGRTALMIAAGGNSPEIVSALLKGGAKIEAHGEQAFTPLMYAAYGNENPLVITTLLKAGAQINYRGYAGLTALMVAANKNPNPQIITVLLKAGANGKLKTDSGDNAFSYAQNNKSLKDTQQLLDLQKATITNPGLGDIVRAGYFDVKVNSIAIKDRVSTGNEFADLKPEEGTKYLIMSVTFKNVANEPGTLFDGTLSVNSGTQVYKIDQSETIMLDGWGLFLDRLNPLVSKTTKLVYKLGSEMKGMAYWQPTGADQTFFIGNIK